MGERELPFEISVRDDGSVVLKKFQTNFESTGKKIGKIAPRITKSFQKVGKALRGLPGAVFNLRTAFLALGAAGVIQVFRGLVRAASEQEDAVARLNIALRNSGDFSEDASRSLQEFADEMQRTTVFGNELILNQIALAKSFGFTNELVDDAVRAAADLSVAAGIELTEAIRRLGRTISGSIEDVSKFAPEIKNLTKQQLAAGKAAEVLGKALAGQAIAQAKTFSGIVAKLSENLGDFQKELGQSITNSEKFRKAIANTSKGVEAINKNIGAKGGLGDSLAELTPDAETVVDVFEDVGKGATNVGISLIAVRKGGIFVKTMFGLLTASAGGLKDSIVNLESPFVAIRRRAEELRPTLEKNRKKWTELTKTQERLFRARETFVDLIVKIRAGLEGEAVALDGVTRAAKGAGVALDKLRGKQEELLAETPGLVAKGANAIDRITKDGVRAFGVIGRARVEIFGPGGVVSQIPRRFVEEFRGSVTDFKGSEEERVEFAKGKALELQDFQRQINIQTLESTANLFGALANLAETGGEKQFKIVQKFRIAEAIVSGLAAINKVLAEGPPFPANVIAAAAIGVQTAANVRSIRAARPGGGGGGGGGLGGGGGGGGGPAPVAVQEPVRASRNISIVIEGGVIGDKAEVAAEIQRILNEAEGDGVQVGVID